MRLVSLLEAREPWSGCTSFQAAPDARAGSGQGQDPSSPTDSSSRFAPYGPAGELILGSRLVPGDGFRETIPLPILRKGWLPYSAVACLGDELPHQ
jgi:hypothetical protein